MIRNKIAVIIDSLVHKNRYVAKKVQGTLVDETYHYLLEVLREERDELK